MFHIHFFNIKFLVNLIDSYNIWVIYYSLHCYYKAMRVLHLLHSRVSVFMYVCLFNISVNFSFNFFFWGGVVQLC
jgi:hypothetical protein